MFREILDKKFLICISVLFVIGAGYFSFVDLGTKRCLDRGICDPDESGFIVQATQMTHAALKPSKYDHPAHLDAMLLIAAWKIVGIPPGVEPINYIVARRLTIIMSTLNLFLILGLARRLSLDWIYVVFAGAVYISSNIISQYGQLFRADLFMTCSFLCATHAFMTYATVSRLRWVFLGCFFTGLAITSKYPGLLASTPGLLLLVRDWWRKKKFPIRLPQIFFGGVLLGILIGSPYMLSHLKKVRKFLMLESVPFHLGADGLGFWGNLGFYFETLFKDLGNMTFLIALFGIGYLIKTNWHFWDDDKKTQRLVPVSSAVVFTLAMAMLSLHWVRWIIPVIPFLAVLAAFGLAQVFKKWKAAPIVTNVLVPLLMIFMLAPPLLYTSISNAAASAGDTRMEALNWAEQQNILLDPRFKYERYCFPEPHPGQRVDAAMFGIETDLDFYKKAEAKWLCINSDYWERYRRWPARFGMAIRLYDAVEKKAPLLFEAKPIRQRSTWDFSFVSDFLTEPRVYFGRLGPTIRIYDISKMVEAFPPKPRAKK